VLRDQRFVPLFEDVLRQAHDDLIDGKGNVQLELGPALASVITQVRPIAPQVADQLTAVPAPHPVVIAAAEADRVRSLVAFERAAAIAFLVGGTILVAATSLIGLVVLVDATVEFFGFGVPQSVSPLLGNLVADTVKFKFGLASNSDIAAAQFGWWAWFFPGVVLVVILVCVNLVGDALDEALNPSST